MDSRKSRLFIPFGLSIGLLVLAVGALQGAVFPMVIGLAVPAALAAWTLAERLRRHRRRVRIVWKEHHTRDPVRRGSRGLSARQRLRGAIGHLRVPKPQFAMRSSRRSPYGRAYRLVCALVIAGMLLGMVPLPVPATVAPQNTAYAAPPQRPAEQAQGQAAGGVTSSGKGQPTVDGPPGVTVNLANGNVLYRRVDLVTSPGGYPFPVLQSELSHNSRLPVGGLGRWSFGYDMSYTRYEGPPLGQYVVERRSDPWCVWARHGCERYRYYAPEYVLIHWPHGRPVRFRRVTERICPGFPPSSSEQPPRDCQTIPVTTFEAPPGVHDRLELLDNDTYRLTTLEGTVYYFDSPRHRKVTRIETENSVLRLAFGYDERGRLTTVRDVYGRALHLTYGDGRVHITNDFLNRSLTLTGSLLLPVGSITDPAGQVTSYSYDLEGRLSQVTLPDGRAYTFSYDDIGRVTAIRGSYGSWDFSYGPNEARVYRTVGGQVRRTRYTFDDYRDRRPAGQCDAIRMG